MAATSSCVSGQGDRYRLSLQAAVVVTVGAALGRVGQQPGVAEQFRQMFN